MIRAAGFRVLVVRDEIETKSQGGIVFVQDEDLEKHKTNTGIVVDIGPNAFRAYSKDYSGEPWCRVGDRVIFARYAGVVVQDPYDDNKEYVLISDDDVAAIIMERD